MAKIELVFGIFFLVIFATIYVFLYFYNRKKRLAISEFIDSTKQFNPVLIEDIQTSYLVLQKYHTSFSVGNYSDIYLFDDFMVLFRKQKFIFTILFPPIVISAVPDIVKKLPLKSIDHPMSDVLVSTIFQNNFEIYKPQKVRILKSEIEITLPDRVSPNTTICIRLKWLTKKQIEQIGKIADR